MPTAPPAAATTTPTAVSATAGPAGGTGLRRGRPALTEEQDGAAEEDGAGRRCGEERRCQPRLSDAHRDAARLGARRRERRVAPEARRRERQERPPGGRPDPAPPHPCPASRRSRAGVDERIGGGVRSSVAAAASSSPTRACDPPTGRHRRGPAPQRHNVCEEQQRRDREEPEPTVESSLRPVNPPSRGSRPRGGPCRRSRARTSAGTSGWCLPRAPRSQPFRDPLGACARSPWETSSRSRRTARRAAGEERVVEVGDDEVGVVQVVVERRRGDHDTCQPAHEELDEEGERKQHRRAQAHRAAPHRPRMSKYSTPAATASVEVRAKYSFGTGPS